MAEYDPIRQMVLVVSAEVEHKEFASDGDQLAELPCPDDDLHDPHVWRDVLGYPLLCRGGQPTLAQIEEFLEG